MEALVIAPASPAAAIEITIATPMIIASPGDWLQSHTPADVVMATAMPLMNATRLSLNAICTSAWDALRAVPGHAW
jgi:hypothetical protein